MQIVWDIGVPYSDMSQHVTKKNLNNVPAQSSVRAFSGVRGMFCVLNVANTALN